MFLKIKKIKKIKTNDVTLVIQEGENGKVLRLNLYTLKSMEQVCKIFKQVGFFGKLLYFMLYTSYNCHLSVCGMGGESELLTVSAEKSFAVGLVHTFFKQRLQMEEYNIVGQLWLNMYI